MCWIFPALCHKLYSWICICIWFLWKDPVFKYEYLEIFIYPWNANIATYPLCKQLFLFASQDYAHNMSYIPLQLLWQVSRILTPMPSGWAISLTGSASIASTTGKLLLELYQSHASLRGDYLDQIRWIFGKKCCAFVREVGARSAFPLPKKRNIIFRIGNDPPRPSEVFRKFFEYGRDSHPLGRHSKN